MIKVDVREGQIEKMLTESYGSYAWKTYFLQLYKWIYKQKT